MPIILPVDKKKGSTKLLIFAIYALLIVGGATMVFPFMITVTSSFANKMDYNRFAPFPRSFVSREDRFVRGIVGYFVNRPSDIYFTNRPKNWSTWSEVGHDTERIDEFAREYLNVERDPRKLARWRTMAADYADFMLDYDIKDTFCKYDFRDLARYLVGEYSAKYRKLHPEEAARLSRRSLRAKALELLRKEWGVHYTSFFNINLSQEIKNPMHHVKWSHPDVPKEYAVLRFMDAYRRMQFRPGAKKQWREFLAEKGHAGKAPWPVYRDDPLWPQFKEFVGKVCPASPTRPYSLKEQWLKFFNRGAVKASLGFDRTGKFDVEDYNALFEADCKSLEHVPFPVCGRPNPLLAKTWERFIRSHYPETVREQWLKFLSPEEGRAITAAEYNARFKTNCEKTADIPVPPPENSPAQPGRTWTRFVKTRYPASLKAKWLAYLDREDVKKFLGPHRIVEFSVEDYNALFGADYKDLREIPFPVPERAHPLLKKTWDRFVMDYYPRRLLEIKVNDRLVKFYHRLIAETFRNVENFNQLMGSDYKRISDVPLPRRMPVKEEPKKLWIHFVGKLSPDDLIAHSADRAWQRYLLDKYGSLEAVNEKYGTKLKTIEEAVMPFAQAYTITFLNNEWRYFLNDVTSNYRLVFEFLFIRGRAFFNTVVLVLLTLLATLTVNPMAAYALSRFRLKWSEQLLLYLLATMAFPNAVRAIPGFLLMRDLHLLNTYAALVLPGMANGMSIFILKGFFDGIPRELYEAATIDGAGEWQMFLAVTLPMTKPILAVNCLNAFIRAYGGWSWALLVCQDKSYWTLSVWLYQMSQIWSRYPWLVMSGFVIASIPTAVVFIACQKVIMRGIVVPSMK